MDSNRVCLHKAWRIAAWSLIALCIAAIFFFSGQDGKESASLSAEVTTFVLKTLTGEAPDMDSGEFVRAHRIVRKLAHAAEYAMLSISCSLLLHTYPLAARKRYICAAAACLPVASLDELMQTLQAARNGTPVDVCIDMLGALIGAALFAAVWGLSLYGRNERKRRASAL